MNLSHKECKALWIFPSCLGPVGCTLLARAPCFHTRASGSSPRLGAFGIPGHLCPQDLQNSNLPSPMRSVKTHDPHLHTVYAREGIAAGLSARPFGSSAAPQELKKACTTALQETPRKLAPLLCKTVWHHSARKLFVCTFARRNGRFCKAQNPRKFCTRKQGLVSTSKASFKQVLWLYATALRPKSGLPLPQRKLDGQQPLVVKCFGSWSEPLGMQNLKAGHAGTASSGLNHNGLSQKKREISLRAVSELRGRRPSTLPTTTTAQINS